MTRTQVETKPKSITPREGYIGVIPVRNIWLLLLYASELFCEIESRQVGVEDNPDDIPDLVADILCHQVEKRIRRNLSYGYRSQTSVLSRVRGRIDLLSCERRKLLDRGKVACRYDDLTVDTPRNRYVLAAIRVLIPLLSDYCLKRRCLDLASSLREIGVFDSCPAKSETSIFQFGRHDVEDRPMVAAAHLAFNLALPTETEGCHHLNSPCKDIYWLRTLYEKAVGGFYRVTLCSREWRVDSGKTMWWQIGSHSVGIPKIFPSSMRTDVVLDHAPSDKRIIIDTKFNAIVTNGWHRDETLRSGYVYQMYAYLRSQEGNGDVRAEKASGLLLHPAVGSMIDERVVIQNHEIRFATVDLAASAKEIREQLLRFVR